MARPIRPPQATPFGPVDAAASLIPDVGAIFCVSCVGSHVSQFYYGCLIWMIIFTKSRHTLTVHHLMCRHRVVSTSDSNDVQFLSSLFRDEAIMLWLENIFLWHVPSDERQDRTIDGIYSPE